MTRQFRLVQKNAALQHVSEPSVLFCIMNLPSLVYVTKTLLFRHVLLTSVTGQHIASGSV